MFTILNSKCFTINNIYYIILEYKRQRRVILHQNKYIPYGNHIHIYIYIYIYIYIHTHIYLTRH